MSIPDGEYDIDLSVLTNDTSHNDINSFALRYGFVPESMDQSRPLTLYDDNNNLILEAKDTNDEQIVFEGSNQTHNNKSPLTSSYYLTMDGGKFKLNKLSNTIRVNKTRNSIKWKNMIKKWNSEHESRKIISESDFEDLDQLDDFNMQFEENELEFDENGEEEVKEREVKEREVKEREVKEREVKERDLKERDLKEKELREKELKEKELKEKELKEKELREKELSESRSFQPHSPPKPTPLPPSGVSGKKVGGKLVSRKMVGGKLVSGKLVSRKKPPVEEDDFEDLENQLEEALGSDNDSDSDSDKDPDGDFISGPIKVIDNNSTANARTTDKTSTSTNTNSNNKKPMSLRELMGDKKNDDLSSSEEE